VRPSKQPAPINFIDRANDRSDNDEDDEAPQDRSQYRQAAGAFAEAVSELSPEALPGHVLTPRRALATAFNGVERPQVIGVVLADDFPACDVQSNARVGRATGSRLLMTRLRWRLPTF